MFSIGIGIGWPKISGIGIGWHQSSGIGIGWHQSSGIGIGWNFGIGTSLIIWIWFPRTSLKYQQF